MSNSATLIRPPHPRIAITPGEPAGIGPDLAIALAQRNHAAAIAYFVDPRLIMQRAHALGVAVSVIEISDPAAATLVPPGVMQVVSVQCAKSPVSGCADTRNSAYVIECLEQATTACLQGNADALVTGPINKALINDAGIPFTGHTEYLAARAGIPLPVMMLVAESLRVALLTTHVPLSAVPGLVTSDLIQRVLQIVDKDLRSIFGLRSPRICVCGLNPHAGEQGHLGTEERDVIIPALASLRECGIDITGPLPADTVFTADQRKRFDVIVAMYHDQGLSALKALGFGASVNVTLGMPFIRTSVDHGTAFDLAGTGKADSGSLTAALDLAVALYARRRAA
jgi:4-hydroxythreonine-4-phosphate dehydrogenase